LWWFPPYGQALGLKVKTGVKILEIQHGDDGMQGVKIEKDGAEDRWTEGFQQLR